MNASMAELIFRIFNDPHPTVPAEAAYLFAQTTCNQESSFEAALSTPAIDVLLLDTEPRSGYPGFESWKKELLSSGFNPNRIKAVPMDDELLLNSRTESQALIGYAMQEGIQTLEIIAPPFHLLRAFMSAITIAQEEQADIRIFSRPGGALPWVETAFHSQGTLEAPRNQLIHEELARIVNAG